MTRTPTSMVSLQNTKKLMYNTYITMCRYAACGVPAFFMIVTLLSACHSKRSQEKEKIVFQSPAPLAHVEIIDSDGTRKKTCIRLAPEETDTLEPATPGK